MYNKLFSKILDSSIWLEDDSTRLVWLTFLAAMDEDGFAAFASIANLSHRARVDREACEKAVGILEGPDKDSSDPENEGRRIERVPGGWMVLNAQKYKELVTRLVAREQNRLRVKRHRQKQAGNGDVMHSNEGVMQSESKDSHSPVKNTPTLDEVIAYGRDQGNVPQEVCEIWWNDHEARPLDQAGHYTDKSGCTVSNWKAALRGFSLRWRNNESKPKGKGQPKPPAPAAKYDSRPADERMMDFYENRDGVKYRP